jgi:hypothetical protein
MGLLRRDSIDLSVLVTHESDNAARDIVDALTGQVECERIVPFASIVVMRGSSPGFHLVECLWSRPGSLGEIRKFSSLLADVGPLQNLRIVSVSTSIDGDVAEELGSAHEALIQGCKAVAGITTKIASARIAVVGKSEAPPHERYFTPVVDHNIVVLPYDRFDDSMHADAVGRDERSRFAAHGAVDVGALCGLWAPMQVAPIDADVMGEWDSQLFGVRLVQSRLRSLEAPTVSLQELFGEQHDALPVPHRYVQEPTLTDSQIDALAKELLKGINGFHFRSYEQEKHTIHKDTLLSVLWDVARGAVKEAPAAILYLVRGELDTVIQLALQEIVDPEANTEVVGASQLDVEDYSFNVGIDPWNQARLQNELTTIPPAVWSDLIDRVLAVVGADPSADDIRASALGGPDRVPCGRRDLLRGLENLPGSLPRLALGDDSLSLLGKARTAERDDPAQFAAPFLKDDLLDELSTNWDALIKFLAEQDSRLSVSFSKAQPFDWSGNVLTMLYGEGVDARERRRLERLDAHEVITDALLQVIGVAPVLINWIGSEDEFRAMLVPTVSRDDEVTSAGDRELFKPRPGLLMRIGEIILEERSKAEAHLEDVSSRLESIGAGVLQHRVQPAIYALMALGFAGIIFEFLTNPVGERALRIVPASAGTGRMYVAVLVAAIFGAGSLTNLGQSRGAQVRFVLALAGWVMTTGTVLFFGDRWSRQTLIVLHVILAALLLLAWGQATKNESELRRRLARIAALSYAMFLVIVAAILTNRGFGPLALISDPQTLLRIGILIAWTSRALLTGGFLVLVVNRGRARVQLVREMQNLRWLTDETRRAIDSYEALGLAYVQWNATACSLAQVVRQPYGPLAAATPRPEAPVLDGIRRAGFARLHLTNRGEDLLRSELREALVPCGWLKQRYEVRVQAFIELEGERKRMTMVEAREYRPETDPLVPTPDELLGRAAITSKRLLFADLGNRGEFDSRSATPIADEALLQFLDPILRDPAAQRIDGGPRGVSTAFEFLVQAGPSTPGPTVPTDEVKDFEAMIPVNVQMQQLLWWPKFVPQAESRTSVPVEETTMRQVGGAPSHGSTAVQLLAVRVDYSPLYRYSTLRYAVVEDRAAEPREMFDSPSENEILG